MAILDLQRRIHERGRIRLGEQVATGNGRKRPAKLTKFRITSRDRAVLEAAAALYGGEVRDWDNGGQAEFELYTDRDKLAVLVPPSEMAFSQWYEQWSAGGCQVRCDGQLDHQADKACHCDPENRACKITTRLSVMLPELPGLGVWRVETHGYYAAVELGGAVEVVQQFAGRGAILPATLRLDQRSVVRDGKTNRFAVPVLDVDVQLGQLAALASGQGTMGAPALPAGSPPAFQPVPAELGAPADSLADQLDAIDHGTHQARGRAPLPSTGRAPRRHEEAAATSSAPPSGPTCSDCGESLAGHLVKVKPGGIKVHRDGCPVVDELPDPANPDDEVVQAELVEDDPPPTSEKPAEQRRREAIIATSNDLGVDWHDVIHAVRGGRTISSKDLSPDDAHAVLDALDRIKSGALVLDLDGDEPRLVVDDPPEDVSDPDPAPAPTTSPDPDDHVWWTAQRWRDELAAAGLKQVQFVKEAHALAEQTKEAPVNSLDDLAGKVSVTALMRGWIEEQGAAS